MLPRIEHFVTDLAPETARALFKESVHSISVAISSYCNRTCTYCPNSITDRKSHRYYMSDDLFFNILRQLCAIDYSGILQIHRYNEPLADREYALARIRYIRVFVPKARVRIFSNGDYLDREYVESLAKLGVDEINTTVHAGAGGKTDIGSVVAEQDRRIAALGLTCTFTQADPLVAKYRVATGKFGAMTVVLNAHDFFRGEEAGNTWAYDRGGVLPIKRSYVRTKPCLSQFHEMEIEWDGSLLPCCQISNEAFPHDNNLLGKLTAASDLFQAYTNTKYVNWRVMMSTDEPKGSPCKTCDYGQPATNKEAVRERLEGMHRVLADAHRQIKAAAG